jgi:outer membrane protein assembly factor BamB
VRRRALLGGVAGLASLAGCVGVFGDTDRSGSTVNPQLQGEPTPGRPAAVAWRANAAGATRLYPAPGVVVVAEDDSRRFRALSTADGRTLWTTEFEQPRTVRPGEVLVTRPRLGSGVAVGLDAETGERLWEIGLGDRLSALTPDVIAVAATRESGQTTVYDRRDGSRLWQTPPGERHSFQTTDPAITFAERPATNTETATDSDTETATDSDAETATQSGVTATATDRSTPTPVTPAPTSDERPIRVQGRDLVTGRLLWSVAVPFDATRTEPVGPHDGRLLLVGRGEYFLFETTGRRVGGGSFPDDLRPELAVTVGDRAYFGNAIPGRTADGPARLGWIDLTDGTSGVREVRGQSVRPLETRDGRLFTVHWTDPGYGVVRRDPADGSPSWSVAGLPLGSRSGRLVVGTSDEIRSHTATGQVAWRVDNPVGGAFGSVVGDTDGTASAVVRDDRVIVVGTGGVASWDRVDGTSRTGLVSPGAVEAWTVTERLVALIVDGTVVAVES